MKLIGQRCDQTVDQLTTQLHSKNVGFGEIRRVDDTHILVRNTDRSHVRQFSAIWSMTNLPIGRLPLLQERTTAISSR